MSLYFISSVYVYIIFIIIIQVNKDTVQEMFCYSYNILKLVGPVY